MTEPFKAERTTSYTCGECGRVFKILRHNVQPQRFCDSCGRGYYFSPWHGLSLARSPYHLPGGLKVAGTE